MNIEFEFKDNKLFGNKDSSTFKSAFSLSHNQFSTVLDLVCKSSDWSDKRLNNVLLELEYNFNKVGFISSILVEKEKRGQGLGRAFMQEYKNKVIPLTDIDFLFARYENPQNEGFDLVAFYEAYGFKPVLSFSGELLMVTKGYSDLFKEIIKSA